MYCLLNFSPENITTSSVSVFFQYSHYTFLFFLRVVYVLFTPFFPWASTFWLPACLDLNPYNSKSSSKKTFPFPTTQKKSSVLVSIEQNQMPCLFLNTIHRGQQDIMLWLANPEFHAHHWEANGGVSHTWGTHGFRTWEGGSPRKSEYC